MRDSRRMCADQSGRVDAVSLPEGIPGTGIQTGPFVDFKVKVREPRIIAGSHRSQLLAPRKGRSRSHGDPVQVTIEAMNPSAIRQTVPKNHHLSPFPTPVPGKDNLPITHRVYRVSEIRIPAPYTIQVFPKVVHLSSLVPHKKRLRIIGKRTSLGANGLLQHGHGRKKKPGKGVVQHIAPIERWNPPL